MVKNTIKVYARIKRASNPSHAGKYEIRERQDHQEIIFRSGSNTEYGFYKNSKTKFRFSGAFNEHATQTDIFTSLGKPVINSVLNGYNGTIFAYGQTGSGKTYSITGSSEYENRGIIPRTIETIFADIQESTNVIYNICISYLEIYNEVAYDLLNPKHRATNLEDLPRVVILEDANGKTHLRNLSVMSVSSEKEAMCLLFLGDTNRTIAETPMNLYSSRSHCIFTVYVSATMAEGGRVRRSKLHLVDLAGSERLQKSSMSGTMLLDAKQINLSLHYLEQVIIALSDSKRAHVPYRNSVMTTVLKDSLGGNCLTVMLATLSLEPKNFDETISTCKFAQRVALVSTDAVINEEDPTLEISDLRTEIENLRKELDLYKSKTSNRFWSHYEIELTPTEVQECENKVADFIKSSSDKFPFDENKKTVEMCFKICKRIILHQQNMINTSKKFKMENIQSKEEHENLIKKKNDEISALIDLLDKEKLKLTEVMQHYVSYNKTDDEMARENIQTKSNGTNNNDVYKSTYLIEMNKCKTALKEKYREANILAKRIQMCKGNIINIKRKLRQSINDPSDLSNKLMSELKIQQDIYRESLVQLNALKKESDLLKHGLWQNKLRLMKQNNQHAGTKSKNSSVSFNSTRNSNTIFTNNFPANHKQNFGNKSTENANSALETPLFLNESCDSFSNDCFDPFTDEDFDPMCQLEQLDEQTTSDLKPDTSVRIHQQNDQNFREKSPSFQNVTYPSIPAPFQPPFQVPPTQFQTYPQNSQYLVPNQMAYINKQGFVAVAQMVNPAQGMIPQPNSSYQYFLQPVVPENYNQVSNASYQSNNNQEKAYAIYNFPEKLQNNNCIVKPQENISSENSGNNSSDFSAQEAKESEHDENAATNSLEKTEDLSMMQEAASNSEQELAQKQMNAETEEYLKTIPLTGDIEVDEEILAFYRRRHSVTKINM